MKLVKSGLCLLCLMASFAFAAQEEGIFGPGQAIADEIKTAAGTDIGWIAGGLLKKSSSTDLASFIQFGSDGISVVRLTGKQIQSALERSISMYPSPNPSFLQISGLEVTFVSDEDAVNKIVSILVDEAPLVLTQEYDVAMPTNLAKGGLGFFTIWDKKSISKSLQGITLSGLLKGKTGNVSEKRWVIKTAG